MRPLFLLMQKVSEKGQEMCIQHHRSHAEDPRHQTQSLGSLHVRFINKEPFSVPDDHWNSSNLT